MILAAQGGVLPVMQPHEVLCGALRCSAVLIGEVRRGRWRRCTCAVTVGRCVWCVRYGEVVVLVLLPCVAPSAWWAT